MDQYLDDVTGIAFHYTQTIDLAVDVAQDVFIKIWEVRRTLDPSGDIVRYLRKTARNAALNAVRHEATLNRLQQAAVREWAIIQPHLDHEGLRSIEIEEFNAEVRTILSRLSPRVQEVALLYHQRGLEPGEIASLLGVAPQTVYNQLRTAMQALSRAFLAKKSLGQGEI
jgi:RNA polymerase sigma-70 factor (ECF subfamily)